MLSKREREKLTYTDIHGSGCKALKDFPGLNISVDGDYIIKRKILIWVAASLPNGNLIVPVIKNADQLNLVGMAKSRSWWTR
jgi:2-oxoglutarate dehydrogenase E2 component (dihydrolipoamide succinyltransferase)